jgi:DNA-binding response OmpR family regulator
MPRSVLAIVDDYQPFLGYLATFLRARGYDVRPYSSGREIVAAVRSGVLPDLVLLDVTMPGLDGLETLRLLKSAAPALPVIMLSGRTQANTVVDAVRLGAVDYLVKPDDPDGLAEGALEAAVKDALERLEAVKVLNTRIEPLPPVGRSARLDADVAAAFPTDAKVNDALRRLMGPHGDKSE